MNRHIAAVLLALAATPLGGCGLQPLYAGGGQGQVARGLAAVDVPPIEGKAGWLVRNALTDRLAAAGRTGGAPAYRLDVRLNDRLEGFGLLADDTIGRERRTLRARYRLVDIATGAVLLDQSASADAGIDVAGSEYATAAAEQTALERLTETLADQIVARVAAYAGRSTR